MFSYSKNGMTVSYQGKMVESVLNGVAPTETVRGDGTMFVSIDGSNQGSTNKFDPLKDTRVDVLTNEDTIHINNTLNYDELGDDVQRVGNKICEIYHSMIS